jgi:hypothetical protein
MYFELCGKRKRNQIYVGLGSKLKVTTGIAIDYRCEDRRKVGKFWGDNMVPLDRS